MPYLPRGVARLLASTALLAFTADAAWATLAAYFNNNAGYSLAASTSYDLIGVEGFEGLGLASNSTQSVVLPPASLTVPASITANSGLNAHKNLSSSAFSGTVVGTVISTQSLTLNFTQADAIRAVGMNVLTPFSPLSYLSMSVRLWDETFLQFSGIYVNNAGTAHVGFLTGLNDAAIKTITLSPPTKDGTTTLTVSAIDNLSAYTVSAIPEASSLVTFSLLSWVGLTTGRRNRD